jgi:hypothetical protein
MPGGTGIVPLLQTIGTDQRLLTMRRRLFFCEINLLLTIEPRFADKRHSMGARALLTSMHFEPS